MTIDDRKLNSGTKDLIKNLKISLYCIFSTIEIDDLFCILISKFEVVLKVKIRKIGKLQNMLQHIILLDSISTHLVQGRPHHHA